MKRTWLVDADTKGVLPFFRWLLLLPICLMMRHRWIKDEYFHFGHTRHRVCGRCHRTLWEELG